MKIYYIHPLSAGPLQGWTGHIARAQGMGFSHACMAPIFAPAASGDIFLTDDFERTNPAIQDGQDADTTTQYLARACGEAGLDLVLDLVLDRVAADGTMARSAQHWFHRSSGPDVVDPREPQLGAEAVPHASIWPTGNTSFSHGGPIASSRLANAGAAGFRLLGLAEVPPRFLKAADRCGPPRMRIVPVSRMDAGHSLAAPVRP